MTRFILLVGLALVAPMVMAQTAVDYYHDAARLYIGGDNEAAEQAAERGLALAPRDARLQALLDRIRQQEQQQSGQGNRQNQQQNENQQSGDQGQPNDESESPPGENQPNDPQGDQDRPEDEQSAPSDRPQEEQAEPQEQEQGGQPQEEQGREDEQPADAPRPGDGSATPEDAMPIQPGQMTRAEAERILNAVGAGEGELLRQVQRRPGRARRVEKDW